MRLEELRELWQYRELCFFMAWRDIKLRYKQTALGIAWAVLQPLLTMAIFLVLFDRIAKIPTDGLPSPLFYYTALVPWIYFSTTLSLCGTSLVSNSDLLTKVYFPRRIMPIATTLSGLVDFGISALLIIGLLVYYQIRPDVHVLLWPAVTILLGLLTYGLGLFVAALTVKYRDVKYAIPFIIQLGLFVTPIIYPASMVPDKWRLLVVLNPLTGIIEAFRSAVIPARPMQWELLVSSIMMTGLIVLVGELYFKQTEKYFADLI
jgi:lipopolysaccharide transport system permease protein